MAKVRALFHISGNLGGANFFERDGKQYARNTSSLKKDRVMTDPRFIRSRENMNEFGGASIAGKAFRSALSEIKKAFFNPYLTGRVTSLFQSCFAAGQGARGYRNLYFLPNQNRLSGFSFGDKKLAALSFANNQNLSTTANRNQIEWSIPAFIPNEEVSPPQGADHFRFVFALVCMSDYIWQNKKWVPQEPDLNGYSQIMFSPLLSLNVSQPASQMANAISMPQLPGPNTTLFAICGIQFLQEIDGKNYPLIQGNALHIASIF